MCVSMCAGGGDGDRCSWRGSLMVRSGLGFEISDSLLVVGLVGISGTR
jgi:hypothetical protein